MSQEPTTYLQLALREDLSQYHRNLIMDTIMVDEFHEDKDGDLHIKIADQGAEQVELDAELIHVAFALGVAHERLEQRYGIEAPFTFTKVEIEHEEDE